MSKWDVIVIGAGNGGLASAVTFANESILVALERAGIEAPARCRSGECGFCRSKLVSGEVFIPQNTDGRRLADIKFGYIHPCSTYPMSDITIKID